MSERLLVFKLDVTDCEAEARLNGVPVARAGAARSCVVVPVHEYTLAGENRLELVVWPQAVTADDVLHKPPPPLASVSTGKSFAHLRLLLPRVGHVADEGSARTLAQLDWSPAAGLAYEAPLTLAQTASLAINFPRWRWLDAPPVEPAAAQALREPALAFVQQLAQSLAAGDPEPFLAATRLRTEELSLAYQRNPADETQRLRAHLLAAFEAGRLTWLPLQADSFVLRSVAGGRLFECLDVSGLPLLRSAADEAGGSLALPLRLAAVEGRFYGLR